MTDESFFTVYEVADKLKIHRNTVRKLILRRELSATVVGKGYRISQSQIDEFLAKHTLQAN